MKRALLFFIALFVAVPASAQYNSYGNFFDLRVSNQLLLPDGSKTTPSWSFASDLDTGCWLDGANTIKCYRAIGVTNANGTYSIFMDAGQLKVGMALGSTSSIGWADSTNAGGTVDTYLYRDAANTLALRNSTAAQAFRIYNTYTDANNYERGVLSFESNILYFGTENAGTGAGRNIYFRLANNTQWKMSATNFYPGADDTEGIGVVGGQVTELYLSRAIQGSKTKALTESSATAFAEIAIPNGDFASIGVEYVVWATDGTDFQACGRSYKIICVNKADTETCATDVYHDESNAVSAGTLTCGITSAGGTNSVILYMTSESSLTQTTLEVNYRLDLLNPQTVTPQ